MHADRGADLIYRYLLYIISFGPQGGKSLVAEGSAFLYVIAVSYCDTVAVDSQTAFLQVIQKKVHDFL